MSVGRPLEWLLAFSIASLVVQILWVPFIAWAELPGPGILGVIQLRAGNDEAFERPWAIEQACMIYLPEEYGSQQCDWPLIVYLHGGRPPGQTLKGIRAGGLPAALDRGRDLPAVVAIPVCRPGQSWQPRDVIWLLDELHTRYTINGGAVYLTGVSLGGYGAWETAAFAPHRFAAIVPVCGGGSETWAPNLTRIPIWAFHGENDDVIPMLAGTAMAEAVTAAGGRCRITVIPKAGHDIASDVYNKKQLYDWLFLQRRR